MKRGCPASRIDAVAGEREEAGVAAGPAVPARRLVVWLRTGAKGRVVDDGAARTDGTLLPARMPSTVVMMTGAQEVARSPVAAAPDRSQSSSTEGSHRESAGTAWTTARDTSIARKNGALPMATSLNGRCLAMPWIT